ncbi:importin-13-like isoform X2 [Halichondria panicea]
MVLIQLCRALVGVAFNTMPDLWPNTVVSCVQSLRSATQVVTGADFTSATLQFLTILPEEFQRTIDNVTAQRRGIIRREICSGLQSVLSLLEEMLTNARDNSAKIDAMHCCSSWVQFGLPLPEVDSLIDHLFACLLVPELLETASDTLQEMLSHDDSFKYPISLRKFLQRLLQIKDFISLKVEENDVDVCMSLAQLVQNAASANLNVLVGVADEDGEEADLCMGVVQLLLEFTCVSGNYPVDELCSEVSLTFWSNFMDHIASDDPDRSRFLSGFYGSIIRSLLEVFPDKAQYPLEKEWQDDWIEEDRDNFTKYREDLCDVGECIQRTMHMEYIQHLSTLLSSLLASSQPPSWQSIEAILYLLQGVSSHLHQHSSPHLQSVISLFPRMPLHPILVKTALTLLGCLSSWFKDHVDLLQAVLPMILDALSQPSLAPNAALAFRDVCGECAAELAPVVLQIVPVCKTALSNPDLDSRDCVRLISAIGSVLSSMSAKDLLSPLESLVQSRVESLQALAMTDVSPLTKGQVEKELVILSSLCHHIYPTLQSGEEHPVVLLLIQLFPSLQALVSKWCTDHDIVESICICFNRGMRTVGEQYVPLLEGTVEIVVQCYAAVHHSKLLDTATQIVEVFGKEGSCSQIIGTLVAQLHSTSVQVFQGGIAEHPDTVQAYLGLMTAVVKVCSYLFVNSESIANNLFEISLTTLQLPEQPTVTASSSFFVAFISLFPSNEAVNQTLSLNGRTLVQYILQAIAWAAPRSYLRMLADILSALSSSCTSQLSQWLEDLLSQDGYPSTHLTIVEKQQFKSTMLKNNKKLIKDKVNEFSLMCRGYHGTLYAAETS